MAGRQLTPFEHILLGLICLAPASGYDLKRIFATPMALYQPSSGALYPALRRLELKGLIQIQAPADGHGQSARHRHVYEPTRTGQAAHINWLRTSIEPATVSRDLGLHLMRFVMMEHLLSTGEVLTFLQNLAGAGADHPSGAIQRRRRPYRPPPAPCHRPRAGGPPGQPPMGGEHHRGTPSRPRRRG